MRAASLITILFTMLIAGCGGWEWENEGGLVDVSTSVCQSGLQWQGHEESSLMNPGRDCVDCHASSHEGPSFRISGTVYGALAEPNDCAGVPDVTIEITDANGTLHTLTSNRAGNFYQSGGSVALPYTAAVVTSAGTSAMSTPQTSASCNSCHQATGLNGAPGRILAP